MGEPSRASVCACAPAKCGEMSGNCLIEQVLSLIGVRRALDSCRRVAKLGDPGALNFHPQVPGSSGTSSNSTSSSCSSNMLPYIGRDKPHKLLGTIGTRTGTTSKDIENSRFSSPKRFKHVIDLHSPSSAQQLFLYRGPTHLVKLRPQISFFFVTKSGLPGTRCDDSIVLFS